MCTKPISLRERKKARTRRALVEAALRLFAGRGFEATTVADIADAADVSPRTFFSYFPAKEDVLFADAKDRIDRLQDALAKRAPDESFLDALRRAARDILADPTFQAGGAAHPHAGHRRHPRPGRPRAAGPAGRRAGGRRRDRRRPRRGPD